MALGQRLAWMEGIGTLGVLGGAILVSVPRSETPVGLWPLAARAAVVMAVCLASFYYNDLYDLEATPDIPRAFAGLCQALGVAALVLGLAYLLFPGLMIAGNLASQTLMLTLALVVALRTTAYAVAARRAFAERVVIMGGTPLARELAEQIATRPDLGMRLVGIVSNSETDQPRLGACGEVADVARRLRADRVIVAVPDRRGALPLSALLSCRVRGVVVEEGVQAYERFTRRVAVEAMTPSTLIFGGGFRISRIQLALKRALSVSVAAGGLLLMSPLIALIAAAIALESPGPVFFVQDRVGLHGRTFRLIKFRTMRQLSSAEEAIWQRDNTSRVTRLGAVLRRYRLDELPQFINILRGDMSLVGPRPEMASNVATFSAVIPYYNLRHEVRPGLTGWAQIKAGYSMTTEEVTRKLCYDLYYIKHLSLAFDLRIVVDTVKFVLSGKRPG